NNNLKQIGFALHNYVDTYSHFPLAAMPNPALPPEKRLSWLVSIVPYMESNKLYIKLALEKGWDAPENRFLGLRVFRSYRCPIPTAKPPDSTMAPPPYVGLAGLGPDAATLPAKHPRAGFFGYDRELTRLAAAHSLLVVMETAQTTGSWTAAGPATVRGLD